MLYKKPPRIGFSISTMREETRVAMLPEDIKQVLDPSLLFFQENYARHLGISDDEYSAYGANIVPRNKLADCDILIIPKRSRRDRDILRKDQTIIGWLYPDWSVWLRKEIEQKKITAIAFEQMFFEDPKTKKKEAFFKEINELCGEIGLLNALGTVPQSYKAFTKIALLGRGNMAKGAKKILDLMQKSCDQYHSENIQLFFSKISEYDLIINCVKWPGRVSYLLEKKHLTSMQNNCFLVNLDANGIYGITAQSIYKPIYRYATTDDHSILVYYNEHVPTLWPLQSSTVISKRIGSLINSLLIKEKNMMLHNATVYVRGKKNVRNSDYKYQVRPAKENAK